MKTRHFRAPISKSLYIRTCFYVRHARARRNHLPTGFEGLPVFKSPAAWESECPANVRFTPKSGHWNSVGKCQLVPKGDICTAQKKSIRTRTRLRFDAKAPT